MKRHLKTPSAPPPSVAAASPIFTIQLLQPRPDLGLDVDDVVIFEPHDWVVGYRVLFARRLPVSDREVLDLLTMGAGKLLTPGATPADVAAAVDSPVPRRRHLAVVR